MATAIPEKIFTVVPLLALASLLALDLYRLWRNKQQLLFRIVIKEFCQGERELNPGKEPLFNQRFRCGYLANACTVMYLHQLQGRVDKPNRLSAGGEILADFFCGILGQVAWGNDLDSQRRRAFNRCVIEVKKFHALFGDISDVGLTDYISRETAIYSANRQTKVMCLDEIRKCAAQPYATMLCLGVTDGVKINSPSSSS